MVAPIDWEHVSVKVGICEVYRHPKLQHSVLLGVTHAKTFHVNLEGEVDFQVGFMGKGWPIFG